MPGMSTCTEECCPTGCAITKVNELMPTGMVTPDNANCGACGNNCNGNVCCCFSFMGGEAQCQCCSAGQICESMVGCQAAK